MAPDSLTKRPARARVLVAEDEPEVRWLIANRLHRYGHDVITAGNGQEALELAIERRPHAAVVDLMMPKLDGFALTRALKADERTREIAVVILSARGGGADRSFAFTCGADDYLHKPFDPRDLDARVRAALGPR